MNPIKKIIILIILFPALLSAAGGSPYTKYGLGDLFLTGSARRLSLGGLGAAVGDYNYINTLNPAGWYSLNTTRLEVGFHFESINGSQNNASAFYSSSDFSGFKIGFPISHDNGVALVLGLVPYAKSNFAVIDDVKSNTHNYTLTNSGTGSLNKAFFGMTYKLPLDIIAGASLEYYQGSYSASSKLEFGLGLDFNDAEFISDYNMHALGSTVGLLTPDLSSILNHSKISNLRFGASYNYISDLKTDTSTITSTLLGKFIAEEGNTRISIPDRFTFGLSFNWDKDYLILLDYLFQPWTNYRYSSVASKFLKDLEKVSLGIEYQNPNRATGSFWEQMILRGGLSYESTQYEIGGNQVNMFSVSGGFTIPLSIDSSIDIGLLFGMRGTKENNLIKENIIKLSATLSFGELWFVRRDR